MEGTGSLPLDRTVFAVGGDFNCVRRPEDHGSHFPDRQRTRFYNKHYLAQVCSKVVLEDLFLDSGASEVVASYSSHPSSHQPQRGYTFLWGQARSRIDWIYMKESMLTAQCRVVLMDCLDHAALTMCLKVGNSLTQGRGYWKLNFQSWQDKGEGRLGLVVLAEWESIRGFYGNQGDWWELVREELAALFRGPGKHHCVKETNSAKFCSIVCGISTRASRQGSQSACDCTTGSSDSWPSSRTCGCSWPI